MKKRSLPLSKVYGLLEPGPVVMVTSHHKGTSNIMTMSWHTMMEFEPPLIGCVISNRNHSFAMIKSSRECGINIPTVEIAEKIVAVGNSTGGRIDKFAAFGLTSVAASSIKAPLIDECYANLECKVFDTRLVNQYNFFILEVVNAWIAPSVKTPRTLHHRGMGNFIVANETIKLASKKK